MYFTAIFCLRKIQSIMYRGTSLFIFVIHTVHVHACQWKVSKTYIHVCTQQTEQWHIFQTCMCTFGSGIFPRHTWTCMTAACFPHIHTIIACQWHVSQIYMYIHMYMFASGKLPKYMFMHRSGMLSWHAYMSVHGSGIFLRNNYMHGSDMLPSLLYIHASLHVHDSGIFPRHIYIYVCMAVAFFQNIHTYIHVYNEFMTVQCFPYII